MVDFASYLRNEADYNDRERDPDADTGGRWFESLIVIKQQGAG
jgi:hypothetical protein